MHMVEWQIIRKYPECSRSLLVVTREFLYFLAHASRIPGNNNAFNYRTQLKLFLASRLKCASAECHALITSRLMADEEQWKRARPELKSARLNVNGWIQNLWYTKVRIFYISRNERHFSGIFLTFKKYANSIRTRYKIFLKRYFFKFIFCGIFCYLNCSLLCT